MQRKSGDIFNKFGLFNLFQRLFDRTKNPEEPGTCSIAHLYGEILQDKVHIVGCAACRSSEPPTKNGYPGNPDWRNEQVELSSILPNGINNIIYMARQFYFHLVTRFVMQNSNLNV